MTDPTIRERLANGEDALWVALDLANIFRLAIGHPVIEKLPYSGAVRSDATDCILAAAIDADVWVYYDTDSSPLYREAVGAEQMKHFEEGGCGCFTIEANARAFAQAAGVDNMLFQVTREDVAESHSNEQFFTEDDQTAVWVVPLQDELAQIAKRFDDRTMWDEYDPIASLDKLDFDDEDLKRGVFYDVLKADGANLELLQKAAKHRGEELPVGIAEDD